MWAVTLGTEQPAESTGLRSPLPFSRCAVFELPFLLFLLVRTPVKTWAAEKTAWAALLPAIWKAPSSLNSNLKPSGKLLTVGLSAKPGLDLVETFNAPESLLAIINEEVISYELYEGTGCCGIAVLWMPALCVVVQSCRKWWEKNLPGPQFSKKIWCIGLLSTR